MFKFFNVKQYIFGILLYLMYMHFYTDSGSGSGLELESDLVFGKWLLFNGQSIYY